VHTVCPVTNINEAVSAELPTSRPSIDLDIGGNEFLLRGKFADWESGLAYGPDLDRVNVRLAIDATSGVTSGRDLFAFYSRDVQPAGNGTYRAVGTFHGARGARPGELTIESPLGHTALIAVNFSATKQDFGEGWRDLIENAGPAAERSPDEGPTRMAHAWLVAPPLAAA
jgi:hypothetical protein